MSIPGICQVSTITSKYVVRPFVSPDKILKKKIVAVAYHPATNRGLRYVFHGHPHLRVSSSKGQRVVWTKPQDHGCGGSSAVDGRKSALLKVCSRCA